MAYSIQKTFLRPSTILLFRSSPSSRFIYPRVVGKSVGLSPLYTLVAAMIGGKLFGILGILFFIPLTAVVLELVKEDAFRRLRTKETLQ